MSKGERILPRKKIVSLARRHYLISFLDSCHDFIIKLKSCVKCACCDLCLVVNVETNNRLNVLSSWYMLKSCIDLVVVIKSQAADDLNAKDIDFMTTKN